jgi:hypothetical protein
MTLSLGYKNADRKGRPYVEYRDDLLEPKQPILIQTNILMSQEHAAIIVEKLLDYVTKHGLRPGR